MQKIVEIDVKDIYPHPDNPRKDLGDLSELTDSIVKNGIMQNLTVVKGHYEGEKFLPDKYTLVIGHRRFEASKAAGLKTVPCKIAELTDREQVSTMLEENMQRNDLTIWEQANGFQLMLDLGETESTIAEKTGFSEQTVKHRLNIAKLDQKALKKAEKDDSYQLTLKDLYELEKIKDVKTRNKILREAYGSAQLRSMAARAAKEEKMDENFKEYQKLLKEADIPKGPDNLSAWDSRYDRIHEYDLEQKPKMKKIVKTNGCVWLRSYGRLYVMAKKNTVEKKKSKEEIRREAAELTRKKITAVLKEMHKRRSEFVMDIVDGKIGNADDHMGVIRELWSGIYKMNATLYGHSGALTMFNKDWYKLSNEEQAAVERKWGILTTLKQMLIVYNEAMMSRWQQAVSYMGVYDPKNMLEFKSYHKVLDQYGWFFTEEELKLLDGTHELYPKEDE